MKEERRSQKSQSSKPVMRAVLSILPLIIALSLVYLPDAGEFLFGSVLTVFVLGIVIGTFTHVYWIRTLLKEKEFYSEFYEKNALKPHKLNKDLNIRHTKIVLPFYLLGFLMFVICVFVLGLLDIGPHYFLPLALGALEGVPISYLLVERGIID
jgi:hypothetical protein